MEWAGVVAKRIFKGGICTGVLAFLLSAVAPASADYVSVTLNEANQSLKKVGTGSGFQGYVDVSVRLVDSRTAVVQVTADPGYKLWGSQAFDLNVNSLVRKGKANRIAEAKVQVSDLPNDVTARQTLTGTKVSSFGSFEIVLTGDSSWTGKSLTFTLTQGASAVPWTSADDVLEKNSKGNTVAAHLYVKPDPATSHAIKGFACTDQTGQSTPVPLPGALLLMGPGLAGLSLWKGLLRR